jgi:hypothetical protein
MGCVREKTSQSLFARNAGGKRALDLTEHLIQRKPQSANLSTLGAGCHPPRQIASRNLARRLGHTIKRTQCRPNENERHHDHRHERAYANY